MNRDWNDFKSLNGNLAGARDAFEVVCESLFRKMIPDKHVSGVKVKVGDGGVDIFIGELGIEPITVIQCKFFLESFSASQQKQIRDSFSSAINSEKYELKEWILCIPRVIDIDENSWWFKWKHKSIKKLNKKSEFIKLINGNELIDLFKSHNLYNQVFQIEDSNLLREMHEYIVPKKKQNVSGNDNPQLILFNNYSTRCEKFYIERPVDNLFMNSLNLNHVWIFGNSGNGKTVLINRNLIVKKIQYCFCDLSPINIVKSDQVIEEIICKIEEKFCLERDCKISNNIKQLTNLLNQSGQISIVIVIDELSVKDDNVLRDISNDLMNLVIHYCNSSTNYNLKFVVSTISNPQIIFNNKLKAAEHFQFVNCDNWENSIGDLFDSISTFLQIDLLEFKDEILNASDYSPRILKTIFRKVLSLPSITSESISEVIRITKSELVK